MPSRAATLCLLALWVASPARPGPAPSPGGQEPRPVAEESPQEPPPQPEAPPDDTETTDELEPSEDIGSPQETQEAEEAEEATETATEAGEEQEAEATERKLSPEEEAKIEERRRKREERQRKRQEKKELEEQKAEDQVSKQEARYRERLDKLLEKGYQALEAEEFRNAQQAFSARLELENDIDFQARMGLARTLLAEGNTVEAIEHSLRAVRDAERDADKAEALVFAGDLSLRSIPRDETTNTPLPGSELYVTTARRYYIQAIRADPEGAAEARDRLEEIFPTPPDERTSFLYGRFLELAPSGAAEHARYLAATYEALIAGASKVPVAVAGGISAPKKTGGARPPYPRPIEGKPPRRILASLIIDSDGSVSEARVLNGIDARHARPAVEVFATWTFEPARLPDGTPVPVHYLAGARPVLTDPLPPEPDQAEESEDSETSEDEEAGEGTDGSRSIRESEDAANEDESENEQ